MDVQLPDGTIVRGVPDGTTKAELRAKLAAHFPEDHPANPSNYGATDLAASKFTMGLSDKAGALGTALGHLARGKGFDYSDAVASQDAAKAAYIAAHPGMDWGTSPLNIMGGGTVATGIRNVGRAAVAAGGAAGLAGTLGGDNPTPLKAMLGTTLGSLVGKGASVVVPAAVGAVVKRMAAAPVRPVAAAARVIEPRVGAVESVADGAAQNAASPSTLGEIATPSARPLPSRSAQMIADAITADGNTPRTVGEMVRAANERGVPLAIMDTGDNARGLATGVANAPGKSRTVMRDAVIARQEGQTERVQGAIGRDLGPTTGVATEAQRLEASAQAAAKPLYEQAYAHGAVDHPTITALMEHPEMKAALDAGRKIHEDDVFLAKAKGEEPPAPLPDSRSNSTYATPEKGAAWRDYLREATGGKNWVVAPRLTDRLRAKGVEVAYSQKQFAEIERAFNEQYGARATPSAAPTAAAPDVRTLDYAKRALDRKIDAAYSGDAQAKMQLPFLRDMRSTLLKALDAAVPDYAAARSAYAGPMQSSEALQAGRAAINKSADDIAADTAKMGPGELDQFKLGLRSALSDKIEGQPDGGSKANALVGTPKKRAVLKSLFGGQEGFDRFMATVADEAKTSATHARINAGSPTARNLADDNNVAGESGVGASVAKAGFKAALGHHLGAITGLIGDANDRATRKAGEGVRAELAAALSETDPRVLADALRQANRARALTRLAGRVGTAAGRPTSAVAGRAGAVTIGELGQ